MAGQPVGAKSAFEVTAGVLPGRPEPEFTRSFWFTTADPDERFAELEKEAFFYAQSLTDPARRNWVRLDWVWF